MVDELVSKSRIRSVQEQIDVLTAKGKRQHLGATEQAELLRLVAEQKHLSEKRSRQFRKIRDGE